MNNNLTNSSPVLHPLHAALAKGNLVEHHFLILPIGHYRSINEIESNPDLDEVYNEIGRFKNALIDFMRSEGKVALFYERNYKSGHLQLQCIGVPHEQAENVEPVLKRVCKERSFSYNEVPMGVRLRSQIASKVCCRRTVVLNESLSFNLAWS